MRYSLRSFLFSSKITWFHAHHMKEHMYKMFIAVQKITSIRLGKSTSILSRRKTYMRRHTQALYGNLTPPTSWKTHRYFLERLYSDTVQKRSTFCVFCNLFYLAPKHGHCNITTFCVRTSVLGRKCHCFRLSPGLHQLHLFIPFISVIFEKPTENISPLLT